uniref:Uncharacterized protein n=1 Tax=viral metagenome TaxID=1070528 RepID=A0A6C0LBU4_9ZZZZ
MSFLEKQNIDLLWDILLDAESVFIMKNNGQYKEPIQKNFITIVKNFYEQEKRSQQSLMELNKKMVSILIHSWMPMLKREEEEQQKEKEKEQQKEKEKEPILFTVEEIQQDRKTQFERELSEKENDFRNAMTQSIPPVIDFHEKKDEPISEMEKLIAETIAQRNFEINQIQNVNKEEAEKWLQSTKTKTKEDLQENTNTNTKKLIKIGEPLLSQSPSIEFAKKQLSWAPQLENSTMQSEVEVDSIFKKLKPSIKNGDNAEINNKLDSLLDKMNILIELLTKKESSGV